ncbi:MAG: T9SS type A sorting domain-containing protein [Chitinophagales bacterium]
MKTKQLWFGLAFLLNVPLHAQWATNNLNTPASILYHTTVPGKAIFTNGTEWDLFDVNTNTHWFGNMAFARTNILTATLGDKAYFAGGKYGYFADPLYTKVVDVYNNTTDSWTTMNLSLAREVGGAGAINNKVVFAGGIGRDFGGPTMLYNKVDIFDNTTGARTTGKLSKKKTNIACGAAANKIVFAGGWYWDAMYNIKTSNSVDIYNTVSGTWSTALLSQKRDNISVAIIGNSIIFAGGTGGKYNNPVKNVDTYNASTNTWTSSLMPLADYGMQSAVIGNKAYFTGGLGGNAQKMFIYDNVSNSWTTYLLPFDLSNFAFCAINDKLYFAGGFDNMISDLSDAVYVYDPATNIWTTEYLSVARKALHVVVSGNTAVFAGGIMAPAYPVTPSDVVDLYTAPMRNTDTDPVQIAFDLNIYPNPAGVVLVIQLNHSPEIEMPFTIFDTQGKYIMGGFITEEQTQLYVGNLAPGNYFLRAKMIRENNA